MDNKGIWGLLNIGYDEAAQRGEDVVRLRLECIVQFVYYLMLSVMFIANGIGNHYIPTLVGAVIQCWIMYASYKVKKDYNRILFVGCMAALSVYLTVVFGLDLGFQYFLYMALVLILLESRISYANKILCCFVSILATVVMYAVNLLHEFTYPIQNGTEVAARINVFNEVAFALNIIIIGLSFAKHQVEAERQLYLANQKLKLAADTDQLTHLPNRRAIMEILSDIDESKTGTVTIAMGDIDHFKIVNDTYGHDAGDAVLKTVSSNMMEFMDNKGYCARWGGEEFLLVFDDINGDDAYMLLDSFRRKLAGIVTEYDGNPIKVTMTFGLEEHGFYQTTDKTIKDADDKLYTGKETGRNKVVY
ncbi:MAG: GGDEF domain-containing protein [Lachnospiraceae bacterium]|nr:GGDEF domain-containing protein [Lachnospiraceae bacterium]